MTIQTNNLSNYKKWKKANNNKKFSIFDYMQCLAIDKKIPIDFYIGVLNLLYPDFIIINNCVFLKEEFDESKYLGLVEQNCKKRELEYWINMINITAFFYEENDDEDNIVFESLSSHIGEQIVNLWSSKLNKEFPNKKFCVNCLKDDEDIYVVFYEDSD